MPNIESDLLLLTINLSQLKNKKRIISLFIEGLMALFPQYQLTWQFDSTQKKRGLHRVCTREKTYGFIETGQAIETDDKTFPHFQNAIQLLAIILERLEQEKLLHNQKAHLQQLVDQQTLELIRSHDEINETNEELATTNEELIESNQSLIDINRKLYTEIEKREAVEKELRDSDKFFNHATDMLCIAGFDGYFKKMNPAWLHVLGWSTEELLSKPWIDFVHPDDIEATKNVKVSIIGGNEVYHFKNRYRTKSGEYKWLSWNSYPYPDEGIMFGIARDVTSVKEAEAQIKQSEENYRTLIEFAPDAFFQGDLKGNFLRVNKKASELSGFSTNELLSMNMSQLFSQSELSNNPLRYDLLLQGQTVINERNIIRKDGTSVLLEMNSRMLPDGTLQSFVRDISERIKTEEQLRTLTAAINQSPNSVVITNNNGLIEYVNPVIVKLSGYKKEELIGKNPRIFASGKTSKEEYKILWDTITSGNVWQGEFQNKKKNGELFWESATISPVINSKGNITHYMAIREDITEQKKMTEELIAAKERAEESDRLKSSFLANMSYEIRTPMNSIMGFASLLPEEESKELMCQYANIIVSNSEQLVHIIDDIVLYSRLQTRLLKNIPSEFTLNHLIRDITQSFDLPEFKQTGINLLSHSETGHALMLKTDYDKLRQVFTNLISNAFKYTEMGSITIGASIEDQQPCFFVKDTGIGIPQNETDKVFERFYRASNVSTGNISGTGLGLCIVKELIELLDGKIWIESEQGKGSTFYFTIGQQ